VRGDAADGGADKTGWGALANTAADPRGESVMTPQQVAHPLPVPRSAQAQTTTINRAIRQRVAKIGLKPRGCAVGDATEDAKAAMKAELPPAELGAGRIGEEQQKS